MAWQTLFLNSFYHNTQHDWSFQESSMYAFLLPASYVVSNKSTYIHSIIQGAFGRTHSSKRSVPSLTLQQFTFTNSKWPSTLSWFMHNLHDPSLFYTSKLHQWQHWINDSQSNPWLDGWRNTTQACITHLCLGTAVNLHLQFLCINTDDRAIYSVKNVPTLTSIKDYKNE